MIKKFLVILVAFVTVFLTQSQVWAAVQNEKNVQKSITVDKSVFFSYESTDMLTEKIGTSDTNSMLWIASIFISGLGQILMGDIFKGVAFFLAQSFLVILGIFALRTNSGGGWVGFGGWASSAFITPFILIFMGVLIIYLHIWNIIDAYNMRQEIIKKNQLDANNFKKLEEQLNTVIELAKKIKISDNGDISVRVFAFNLL